MSKTKLCPLGLLWVVIFCNFNSSQNFCSIFIITKYFNLLDPGDRDWSRKNWLSGRGRECLFMEKKLAKGWAMGMSFHKNFCLGPSEMSCHECTKHLERDWLNGPSRRGSLANIRYPLNYEGGVYFPWERTVSREDIMSTCWNLFLPAVISGTGYVLENLIIRKWFKNNKWHNVTYCYCYYSV